MLLVIVSELYVTSQPQSRGNETLFCVLQTHSLRTIYGELQPLDYIVSAEGHLFVSTLTARYWVPPVLARATSAQNVPIYTFHMILEGGGHAVEWLVETSCYKPEVQGFDSQ
jgi:hypothetical protein